MPIKHQQQHWSGSEVNNMKKDIQKRKQRSSKEKNVHFHVSPSKIPNLNGQYTAYSYRCFHLLCVYFVWRMDVAGDLGFFKGKVAHTLSCLRSTSAGELGGLFAWAPE